MFVDRAQELEALERLWKAEGGAVRSGTWRAPSGLDIPDRLTYTMLHDGTACLHTEHSEQTA